MIIDVTGLSEDAKEDDLVIFDVNIIPEEVRNTILALGELEWGATDLKTIEEHLEDYKISLENTSSHFQLVEKTSVQGIYLKDTEIVVAKTGNSPNSVNTTPLFVFLWNMVYDNLYKKLK